MQRFPVPADKVGGQVRPADQGERTMRTLQPLLVLVQPWFRTAFGAGVAVHGQGVLVGVEEVAGGAGDPSGLFEPIGVIGVRVGDELDFGAEAEVAESALDAVGPRLAVQDLTGVHVEPEVVGLHQNLASYHGKECSFKIIILELGETFSKNAGIWIYTCIDTKIHKSRIFTNLHCSKIIGIYSLNYGSD
jgi:hypothetical protein